jgi:hypothetical protein
VVLRNLSRGRIAPIALLYQWDTPIGIPGRVFSGPISLFRPVNWGIPREETIQVAKAKGVSSEGVRNLPVASEVLAGVGSPQEQDAGGLAAGIAAR